MNLKDFEEFLRTGIVKKQSPNKERTRDLIREAKEKKEFLDIILKNMSKKDMRPNFIIEYCYDILMELIRAKMLEHGFNSSGKGAHEAEVAYTRKIGFSEAETRFLNELRYYRNGIVYYGKNFDKEYAQKVLIFLEKIFQRFEK